MLRLLGALGWVRQTGQNTGLKPHNFHCWTPITNLILLFLGPVKLLVHTILRMQE